MSGDRAGKSFIVSGRTDPSTYCDGQRSWNRILLLLVNGKVPWSGTVGNGGQRRAGVAARTHPPRHQSKGPYAGPLLATRGGPPATAGVQSPALHRRLGQGGYSAIEIAGGIGCRQPEAITRIRALYVR